MKGHLNRWDSLIRRQGTLSASIDTPLQTLHYFRVYVKGTLFLVLKQIETWKIVCISSFQSNKAMMVKRDTQV